MIAAAVLLLAEPQAARAVARPEPSAGRVARNAEGVAPGSWLWPVVPRPPLRAFAVGPFRWSRGHRGIDLPAPVGSAVLAPTTSTITFAGRVAGQPVVVLATAGRRITFEPAHATVPTGATVRAGEPFARITPAAASRASHCPTSCLHLGVKMGGTYLDPRPLFRTPQLRLLPR